MSEYYDDLLALCGYEPDEIEEDRPRVEEAFRRLGIVPADMEPSWLWVRKHYDVSLMGVRKALGAYLKEMIDAVLAKDEGRRSVYFGFPAMLGPGLVLSAAGGDRLQVCAPDVIVAHAMGEIFNKLTPIIQAGESNGLPPGHGLCSLWQVKIGLISQGIVPPPAFNFSSGYFCDMSAVGDSLLRARYGTPAGIIDGSMDGMWGEYPLRRPEKVKFIGSQIRNALEAAQRALDVEILPEHFETGMKAVTRYRELTAQIVDLMKADPVPLGMTAYELLEAMPGASTGRGVREMIKAMEILVPELRARVEAGLGATAKGAPRVMVIHGHMADPRISGMYEELGMAVPLTYITAWNGGMQIEVEECYPDVYQTMAAHELAIALPYGGDAVLTLFIEGSRLMKLDGFIMRHLVHCRPASCVSRSAKTYLEERTGLPCMNMDEDMVDSRVYSASYMRTKMEAFAEMLKAKKAWESVDTDYDE